MNDSKSRAWISRGYEHLKAMDDMSYTSSWAQALDAINNSLL